MSHIEHRGRRREDTRIGDLPPDPQPGDYWRYIDDAGEPLRPDRLGGPRPENLTGGVWGVVAPNGAGHGTLVAHTVREEDDGTISVRPGDGSSNSILITGPGDAGSYHGFIERGVWRS